MKNRLNWLLWIREIFWQSAPIMNIFCSIWLFIGLFYYMFTEHSSHCKLSFAPRVWWIRAVLGNQLQFKYFSFHYIHYITLWFQVCLVYIRHSCTPVLLCTHWRACVNVSVWLTQRNKAWPTQCIFYGLLGQRPKGQGELGARAGRPGRAGPGPAVAACWTACN